MPGVVTVAAAVGVFPQSLWASFTRQRVWAANINQYSNGEVQVGKLVTTFRSRWLVTRSPGHSVSIPITGATNASPIVVTAGVPASGHGLFDGQSVTISGVGGNTGANVAGYAKTSAYSRTTFGLYSNSSLTTAVAGTGGYTSGGVVTTSPAEALRLFYLAHKGPHIAFYFYDPEVGPTDPTGVSTTGRFIVRFDGPFSAAFGIGRASIPLILVEVV